MLGFFHIIPLSLFESLVVTLFLNNNWTEQLLVSTLWFDVCLLNKMRGAWPVRKSGNRLAWLISSQKQTSHSSLLAQHVCNSLFRLPNVAACSGSLFCLSLCSEFKTWGIMTNRNIGPTKGNRISIHLTLWFSELWFHRSSTLRLCNDILLFYMEEYEALFQSLSGSVLKCIFTYCYFCYLNDNKRT